MPTEVVNAKNLNPGDVLMVARQMRDKQGKRFVWRFFVVVTRSSRWVIGGIVVGAGDKIKNKELTFDLNDDRNTIQLLDVSEWPDGIHAFRMAMVLKGLIPDVV